jgi:hypothetical protein
MTRLDGKPLPFSGHLISPVTVFCSLRRLYIEHLLLVHCTVDVFRFESAEKAEPGLSTHIIIHSISVGCFNSTYDSLNSTLKF